MTEENSAPTNLRSLMIMEVIGLSDRALTVTEINQHVQLAETNRLPAGQNA